MNSSHCASRNMLEQLPRDVVEYILESLGPISTTWPTLGRVCKSIRALAMSSRLWRRVEFHNVVFNADLVMSCVHRSQARHVRVLDLFRVKGLTVAALHQFREFERLEMLAIRYTVLGDQTESHEEKHVMAMTAAPASSAADPSSAMGGPALDSHGGVLAIPAMRPNHPTLAGGAMSSLGDVSSVASGAASSRSLNSSSHWSRTLRFLNLTNFAGGAQGLRAIRAPALETLIASGTQGPADELMMVLLESCETLSTLDVSRTSLHCDQVAAILQQCSQLSLFVATEIMQRSEEAHYSTIYPHVQILFDLLSHNVDPINQRRRYITTLYDVDGKGCSLIADGLFVGMDLSALRHVAVQFHIDPNRCDEPCSPWVVPFPMKHLTSVSRFPLGLHQAAAFFELDAIRFLFDIGANPNLGCPEHQHRTALSLAVAHAVESQQCVRLCLLLCEHGARLDATDDRGKTVIDHAVDARRLNLLATLIPAAPPLPQTELDRLVLLGIQHDCLRLLEAALAAGGTLRPHQPAVQALITAIRAEGLAVAQHVIRTTPELLNKPDPAGWRPIHHALAIYNRKAALALFRALLQAGAHLGDMPDGTSFRAFLDERHLPEAEVILQEVVGYRIR